MSHFRMSYKDFRLQVGMFYLRITGAQPGPVISPFPACLLDVHYLWRILYSVIFQICPHRRVLLAPVVSETSFTFFKFLILPLSPCKSDELFHAWFARFSVWLFSWASSLKSGFQMLLNLWASPTHFCTHVGIWVLSVNLLNPTNKCGCLTCKSELHKNQKWGKFREGIMAFILLSVPSNA